ncbi:hypothetical protein WJX72_002708 [[Myrmecia] bisecta]|uniref:SBP-type domain-containing protein n=1 Tax=[Myrmecia] bisecta TaxID=41462 RepID=A0AAW1Q3H3_9CHLO
MSGPGPSNGHWRPEDYAWDPHRMVAQRVPEAAIQTGDSQSGADSDPKGEVGRRPPERRRRAGAEATASASDPDQATPSAVPKVLDTLHNTGGLKKKVPLYCQIDGCNKDLSKEKEYYQRYRVCEEHLKLTSLMKDGQPQRFCQQCGRFHLLTDFDGDKRSCRARLQLHNNRRRKRASSSEAKAARKAAVAAAREEPPPPKLVPRRNRTHLRRKRDTHDEGPAAEAEGQWEAEEDDRREATVSGSLGALGVGSGGDESEGNEGLAAEGQGGRTPYDREIAQMYKQYPPAIHQALASLQGLTPGSLGPRPSPLPAAHRQPPHPLLPDLPHDISAMYHSDTDRPMAQSNPAEMGVRMDVGEGNYNLLRYFSEPVKGMAPGMPSASHPFMPGLPYASSPAQDIQRYMSEPVKGLGVAPRPPYAHLSHAAAAAQFDVFGEELEAVDMAHYLAHMQNAGHRAPSPRRPPLRSPLQRHQSLERMSNGSPMGPGSGRPDARSLDSSFDPRAAAQGSLRSGSGARGDGMAGAPLDTRAASGLASGASLYKCASDPVYGVAAGMPQRHGSYGGVAPRPYADWGGGQAAMASRMLNQPGFGDLSTLGEDDNDEGPPLQFRAGPRPAYGMQPERQAAPPRPDPYLSRLGRGPEPSANPSTGALDRGQAHMAPSTLAGQLLQGMQQPEAALPHGMVASSGMHAYPRATNPANAFAVASSGYATNPANAFAAASSGYATNPANAFAAASTAPLHPSEPSAPAFRIGGLSTGFGSVSAAEHNASTPASSLPPLVRRARLPAEQDVGPDGHWTEEQIHRMQLKIMNQSPADLPLDMRDSLISMLQHQPTLLEGYIRPGCVHVTVDMVCRRSQLPSSPLMLLEAVERLTRFCSRQCHAAGCIGKRLKSC